jgi:hypothetical protein
MIAASACRPEPDILQMLIANQLCRAASVPRLLPFRKIDPRDEPAMFAQLSNR